MSETEESVVKISRVDTQAIGGDYFKIWIVNIFLSIITLGIYSAWAKIRTKKYFYQTTKLEGDRFDFHAKPIPILKGRIIAGIVLFLYVYGAVIHPVVGFIGSVLFAVCFPFFVIKGLKFNIANSSYKGVRFHLTGSLKEGYGIFVKNFGLQIILVLIFTLVGILFPELVLDPDKGLSGATSEAALYNSIFAFIILFNMVFSIAIFSRFFSTFLKFIYGNLYYGGVKMNTSVTKESVSKNIIRPYFKSVLKAIFGFIILIIAGGVLTKFTTGIGAFVLGFAAVFLYGYMVYIGYRWSYNIFNLVWNNLESELGDLKADLRFRDYFKLSLKNHFFTVITLGLYYPWAKVSMYELKSESKMIHSSNFELAVTTAEQTESAVSEEIGDAFDFDFDIGF